MLNHDHDHESSRDSTYVSCAFLSCHHSILDFYDSPRLAWSEGGACLLGDFLKKLWNVFGVKKYRSMFSFCGLFAL